VIEKAEVVAGTIVDTYFVPNRTFPELRKFIHRHAMDPLRAVGEECRAELQAP
jgi:hypothetical protein